MAEEADGSLLNDSTLDEVDRKSVGPQQRQPPMSPAEDEILLNEYQRLQSVLTCTDKGANSNAKKQKGWKDVTEAVNTVSKCVRSVESVKNRFTHLTKVTKGKNTQVNKSRKQTGGGVGVPNFTPTEEKVMDLLADSANFNGHAGSRESAIGKRKFEDVSNDAEVVEPKDKKPPTVRSGKSEAAEIQSVQLQVLKGDLVVQSKQLDVYTQALSTMKRLNELMDRFEATLPPIPTHFSLIPPQYQNTSASSSQSGSFAPYGHFMNM